MTGFDIFETALIRLGLINEKSSLEQQIPLKNTAVSVINELSFELCNAEPIVNLKDEINISREAATVISYGTAFALATIMGDDEKKMTMLAIFNAKKALYLSEIKIIEDVLPTVPEV